MLNTNCVVTKYAVCDTCDHFCEPDLHYDAKTEFVHCDVEGVTFDHLPAPGGKAYTIEEWKSRRPELFKKHPDGKIGPASIFHVIEDTRL